MFCCSCLFFFFKQKTAYEMRISDWSSDVCSSDLLLAVGVVASLYAGYLAPEFRVTASQLSALINGFATILLFAFIDPQLSVMTDDADRKSVVYGKSVSVRVDLGGRRIIKQKNLIVHTNSKHMA